MMPEQRKLAAIMFTDIVGYSALMSKDEKMAMNVLAKNREIHKVTIERFNGQYIKEIGDGTLAIFPSSVDAVSCALEIQKVCCKESEFQVRIGIHIGDIIFKDSDVFGDGVNIASRIESSGEPGEIYISEKVYDDIRNKSGLKAEFIGEKKLKNIDQLVKVYALRESGPDSLPRHGIKSKRSAWLRKRKYPAIIITLTTLIATLAIIYLVGRKEHSKLNRNLIAVTEFENQTGDETLDPIGKMAADWITQGISSTGLISVIPSQKLEAREDIHQNMEAILTLAKKNHRPNHHHGSVL